MRAVIVGATGLVGSRVVDALLSHPSTERVRTLVRRSSGRSHELLDERVIDFERPTDWAPLVEGDVLISALGTTKRAAGSEQAQWRVDHDYQLWAARAAAESRTPSLVLVSSTGADPRSWFFYPKMKGQLEERVDELGFSRLTILRPSLLDGDRQENRPGERAALRLLGALPSSWLSPALVPVPASRVARACVIAAERSDEGPQVWEAKQLLSDPHFED